jgi:hypothetical protein
MKTATVLNFGNKNNTSTSAADLSNKIVEMLGLKLEALTARARLACQNVLPVEAEELERISLEKYLQSQELSTPEIDTAFRKIGHKGFQNFAIWIASLMTQGKITEARNIFETAIVNLTEQILDTIGFENAQGDRIALAA